MSKLQEKVKKSIDRLKAFEPPEGYYLAFSGGKDSVVCKALLDMSGCKYDATYRITSVDPPELVRFIKEQHPDVKREAPRYSQGIHDERLRGKVITMWNLIPKEKYPPTRISRYCCRSLKESGGDGRMTVTGVRWEESRSRAQNQGAVNIHGIGKTNEFEESDSLKLNKSGGVILTNDNDESRRLVERCYKRNKTTVNPIIEWTGEEVWEFIKAESIPYCSLYDEGFYRLGCIGCPLSRRTREVQFKRWPKYKDAYILAFQKMLEARENAGLKSYDFGTTGEEVFNWWMEYDVMPGQVNLFDNELEEEE
jgi:phosphoadenosine phosphosulfate reductase